MNDNITPSESNKKIYSYIVENLNSLSESILQIQFEKSPELLKTYNSYMKEKCLEDITYHLQALADAIISESPVIFSDYISWAYYLLEGLGIDRQQLILNLQCMEFVLRKVFSFEYENTISKYILDALERLTQETSKEHAISYITPENKHWKLAEEYLKNLLDGRRKEASYLIQNTFKSGIPVKEIYMFIFEPALKEVGLLWQTHKINVAQEHYFTAVTQLIMSQLYEHVFTTEKNGLRFVGACVNDELHEIGIRMVADVLESEGWDTYYLGANVPADSAVKFLKEKKPHVFGLSCTLSFHIHNVIETIERIRKDESIRDVKIIVGGYPFSIDKELWKKVGADGMAKNLGEIDIVLKSFNISWE
ncbi:MAG: cobalamin-dependent protein [Fervidobacterium sp.]|nr:cobalamin-dependent protein [Fervidobacterium sp.]